MRVPFDCYLNVVKAYEEKGRWIVEGLAATTDFDLQDDIISQEAIESSARDLIENSTVLHNHDSNESIGRVLASRARSGALFLKILVSKTVPDIWQKIKEGVLNKFSIRGRILEAAKKWIPALQKFARVILKMQLVEVSLVAVPANPKAKALRWYIEKALSDYEEGGGEMQTVNSEEYRVSSGEKDGRRKVEDGSKEKRTNLSEHSQLPTSISHLFRLEGGTDMAEEMEVEEELLEAHGEPRVESAGERNKEESKQGFPAPERLRKEWTAFGEKKGLKEGDDSWDAWLGFCKEQGYPYPYLYPYPQPERGTRMRQIAGIVDSLLAKEKDEEKKKLLVQIRALAVGASNAYPKPQGKSEEPVETAQTEEPASEGAESVEKAGRKISTARLARLKKLLEELQKFIAEVDASGDVTDEKEKSEPAELDLIKKVDTVVAVIEKLSKALGFGEGEAKDTPTLVESVKDISKRLETLEGTPGERSSLEGQESLGGAGEDKGVWKGLL